MTISYAQQIDRRQEAPIVAKQGNLDTLLRSGHADVTREGLIMLRELIAHSLGLTRPPRCGVRRGLLP